MPNPKRRFSHQRTALRRTHDKTELPELIVDRRVGAEERYRLRHHASPDGYYKGRRLPGFKDKEKE